MCPGSAHLGPGNPTFEAGLTHHNDRQVAIVYKLLSTLEYRWLKSINYDDNIYNDIEFDDHF